MLRLYISAVLCAQLVASFTPAPQAYTLQNPCTSKTKCNECIQTPSCAWCNHPKFENTPRCFNPTHPVLPDKECPPEYTYNPLNVLKMIKNLALTEAHAAGGGTSGGRIVSGYSGYYNNSESFYEKGTSSYEAGGQAGIAGSGHIVQVAPQRLSLKLRARESYSVHMRYTQAEDYPVDLYYLMDLSRSMEDDKEKLSSLGDLLAQTMQKLTSNFTLGFGSFVDKVVMPFVSTVPENLEHPCIICKREDKRDCEYCAAPYGYHHLMRLSQNTYQFAEEVKRASVSGNLDAPEGGFDAIMQAIVCRNEIGWREQARRLLVFSTDASFHFAGDGKLGGIVKPNDGKCHLQNGRYTESSHQDYPSIEQINLNVKKNAINIIFAVTNSTIGVYKELAQHIEGASTAELQSDSSNIVELIQKEYEKISSSVEMKHNASSAVSIKFFTRCLNSSGALVPINKCGNIKVGDVISFKIDLEVLECPENPADRFQTIQIYPVGINESLTIDLEMLCSCNCEKPGDTYFEHFSSKCSDVGTYKCGVCECPTGAFGPHCECTDESDLKSNRPTIGCIPPNSTTDVECSNKGHCICGRCECDTRSNEKERIYGPYCECDNFSCERHNGKLCSDHGECECGKCICKEGWEGNNCACSTSTATCYLPGVIGGEICSGHGQCVCGKCECEETKEGRYSGRFCEKCPTCADRCLEFKDCVQCQQYQTGPLKDPQDCKTNCTKFVPIEEDVIKVNEDNNENFCAFYDEDECRFTFVYYFDEKNNLTVRAQKERECPAKVYVPGIVLGVIAAIVLIGMAMLLLWKLLTTIHDRREFARFEKEKAMAKWDTGENPIYKQATSTFKNPTYAGKG